MYTGGTSGGRARHHESMLYDRIASRIRGFFSFLGVLLGLTFLLTLVVGPLVLIGYVVLHFVAKYW